MILFNFNGFDDLMDFHDFLNSIEFHVFSWCYKISTTPTIVPNFWYWITVYQLDMKRTQLKWPFPRRGQNEILGRLQQNSLKHNWHSTCLWTSLRRMPEQRNVKLKYSTNQLLTRNIGGKSQVAEVFNLFWKNTTPVLIQQYFSRLQD